MTNPILQLNQITLSLGETQILKAVDLTVLKGEWLTILGKNGSGKTSLLKSILQLHAYSGEILINDNLTTHYSAEGLAKLMSYVPQTPPSDLQMSVMEFLLLARYPYRNDLDAKSDDPKIIDEILTELAISELSPRNFSTLSGGEQQKVLIASALIQETPIILLDEPSSFLDPALRTTILNKLKTICRQRNVAVIEVSHDLNTTVKFADRFIALKAGHKILDLPINQLLIPETLYEIYDQSFQILHDRELNLKVALPLGVSQ